MSNARQSPSTPVERLTAEKIDILQRELLKHAGFAHSRWTGGDVMSLCDMARNALVSETPSPSRNGAATPHAAVRDLLEKIIQVRGGLHSGFQSIENRADEMARLAAEAMLILEDAPVSETSTRDLEIKAEAMNMVLSVVSAKANVGTETLMSMLKEAEEELRAKRWLS